MTLTLVEKTAPWQSATRKSRAAEVIGDTSHLRRDMDYGAWFVTVPGKPVGQPRSRSGNGRHYSTAKQAAAATLIARCAREQNAGRTMIPDVAVVYLVFIFPHPDPKRWGKPMGVKPDYDNCAKMVCDALGSVGVWRDDARVACGNEVKLWGRHGRSLIQVEAWSEVPAWATHMLQGAPETIH